MWLGYPYRIWAAESESGLRISPRPHNFPLAQGKSVKSWKFQAPLKLYLSAGKSIKQRNFYVFRVAKFESDIRIQQLKIQKDISFFVQK